MITIGQIVAAHGIRGHVRVRPYTDFPDRFQQLDAIWLREDDDPAGCYHIEDVGMHAGKGLVLLKLREVNDRDTAKALTGHWIEIEDDETLQLPEDTYFQHDIIGLEVLTNDGRSLGTVTDILKTGSNDVYVTPRVAIPAISSVIADIDIENGVMTVIPVPGLLAEDE